MHLSDKKSENVKLRTEGAQLRTSCPREQATPKEESLVGVPRFAGGGRGTGPGVWFQDLSSPPPCRGSGVHAQRPGPIGLPALQAGSPVGHLCPCCRPRFPEQLPPHHVAGRTVATRQLRFLRRPHQKAAQVLWAGVWQRPN